MSDGITLKGHFQPNPLVFLRWFFGFEGRLSRLQCGLALYTSILALTATVTAVTLLLSSASVVVTWPLFALAAAALVADRQSVSLRPGVEISVAFLPIVLATVISGPLAGMLVSAFSLLLDFRPPYARWLVWTSSRSLAAGGAGYVGSMVDPSRGASFTRIVAAVAVATAVFQLGDFLLSSVTARLRGVAFQEMIQVAGTIALAIPLYMPLTAVLVYSYREVSPWSVVFFLVPAFAAQKLFLLYQEQRATAEELASAVAQQERAHLSFATALVATLDARDRYTAGHSAAVAVYAEDIAKRLCLSEADQQLAHLSGLVHDIGKIGLPAGLLEKPGPLTLDERRQMEQHSVIGERILAKVDDYAEIARIVRHHHERFDGQGYPDGLAGEEIPLLSRIIAAADAYNAMTSRRPYREAMPSRVARLRMAQAVETQFDTAVVAAFEAVLAGASEGYRAGYQSDFDFFSQHERLPRPVALVAS